MITIEQARQIACDELTRQGRTSLTHLILLGRMDDDPAVLLALEGKTIPDPWSEIEGAGVLMIPTPSYTHMGMVPNIAKKAD